MGANSSGKVQFCCKGSCCNNELENIEDFALRKAQMEMATAQAETASSKAQLKIEQNNGIIAQHIGPSQKPQQFDNQVTESKKKKKDNEDVLKSAHKLKLKVLVDLL